jgi:hypothetical protein
MVRLILSPDSAPDRINRFLLPEERRVISVRQHPARLLPPLGTAIGGLLAAVAVGPVVQGNRSLELTVGLLVGTLIAQLALVAANWSTRYLVVTSRRVFLYSGLFTYGITFSLPLENIQDIRLTRSYAGRLYGYGTFVFESAHRAIDYVPYPEQLYLEIAQLFVKNTHPPDPRPDERPPDPRPDVR